MTHDARLVPAALTAWAAATLALTGEVPPGWGVGAAGTAAVVALALLVWVGHPRARAPAGPSRHGLAMQVLLCAAVAVAVVLGARAQLAVRLSGGFEELRDDGAAVVVEAVALADAHDLGPASRYDAMVEVRVGAVGAASGSLSPAAARVTALGDVAMVRRGDRVRLTGTLATLSAREASQALLLDAAVAATHAPAGGARVVRELRGGFVSVTAALSAQGRGLVPGIAIGDDSRLPETLREAMRRTSLGHLTAVSGAHVALVLSLFALAAARAPTRLRAALLLGALLALLALVGPEASVVRAAAMGCAAIAALARGRPPKAVPALATAVVVLLVVDPWLAFSFGFALSVSATAALLVLAPRLGRAAERHLSRTALRPERARRIATVLAVPLAAHLACAPIIVLFNPSISVFGVLANAVAAPAVPPATLLGLAAVAATPASATVGLLLARGAEFFTGWIAGTAMVCSRLPASSLPWPGGGWGALALAALHTLAVAVMLWAPLARWRLPRSSILAVALTLTLTLALAAALGGLVARRADWTVYQCDVGQGSALLVRSGPVSAVMVDVGPEDGRSQDCLARAGISRLDLLVLTHPHADHVGNLAAILATASVGEVLVSPATEPAAAVAAVGDELAFAGAEARTAVAGDAGQAGDVGWEVLWPAADTTLGDANDLSIVVLLTTRGGRVAALGDLQEAGQAGLLDAVAACVERCTPLAVVAMAHHGSKFQDPALAALLDPAVTLVSVGEDNSYGHPAPEAIELYEGVGTSLWRTDVDGEIRIAFKGGNAVVDGG